MGWEGPVIWPKGPEDTNLLARGFQRSTPAWVHARHSLAIPGWPPPSSPRRRTSPAPSSSLESYHGHGNILLHEHIHIPLFYTALTYIIYHTSYTVQGKAVTAQDMLSRSMSVTVDSKDAKLIGGGYRGALTRVGLHQAIGLGAELRERYGEFT